MNTYIVTPTWNCADELDRCARALIERTMTPVSWVVVENGSEPKQRTRIEEILAGVKRCRVRLMHYICNETNLGIPMAQNQALDWIASYSSEPYQVLLLDADAEPAFQGWLANLLLFAARNPDVGLIGGSRSPHGASLPVYYNHVGRWYQHDEMAGRGEMYSAECIDFATALLTWNVLREGIRFDTGYRIYDGHDQDLAFRVRSWGYDVRQAEATVDHRPSSAMKGRDYQWDGGGRREWDALRAANIARFVRIWGEFLAPERVGPDAEIEHVERMNQQLIAAAGKRKAVPM